MRAPRKRPSTSAKVRGAPRRAAIVVEDTRTVRHRLQPINGMHFVTALAALMLMTSCGPGGGDAAQTADAPPAGEQGFAAPPELTSAAKVAGGIQLTGRASAGARVRLATPAGAAQFAVADAAGQWRLLTPAAPDPRLFGLSMSADGRLTQAEGYLFLAPDGTVTRLRAGGGSEALGTAGAGLVATVLDVDGQKAATLSGRAAAGETVTLRVDGVERGQAEADTERRFVLPMNQLAAGTHDFDLFAPSGQTHLSADISTPAPLGGSPFRASRAAAGWRVDWLTPGGGEQTTLIFDVAEPAH